MNDLMGEFVVLDLFSCEGVGGSGYMRAGATVYAIDLFPRFGRRHPGAGFLAADAIESLHRLANGGALRFQSRAGVVRWLTADQVHMVHTSPPCQAYTRGNAGKVTNWPRLIGPTRDALQALGLPYVIENVKDARPELIDPVTLCGCMFDLTATDTDGTLLHLQRPRLFETSWGMVAPRGCDHGAHAQVAGAYRGARRDKHEARQIRKGGYVPPSRDVVRQLLGVDPSHDLTWNGLFESIPPAYTDHIGRSARAHAWSL